MKKDDKVFIIRNWNGIGGTFYIQKATINSFGKKEATFFIDDKNQMAKQSFSVPHLNPKEQWGHSDDNYYQVSMRSEAEQMRNTTASFMWYDEKEIKFETKGE